MRLLVAGLLLLFASVASANELVVKGDGADLTFATRDGRELDGADFYHLVGRDDLARSFSHRRTARNVLLGAATITGIASALTLTGSFGDGTVRDASYIMMGAAVGMLLASQLISPQPVDAAEARRLAQRALVVAPMIGAHGAGLVAAATF
jgi:hypothetical protein